MTQVATSRSVEEISQVTQDTGNSNARDSTSPGSTIMSGRDEFLNIRKTLLIVSQVVVLYVHVVH